MRKKVFLIRYADDFVLACEQEEDARRLMRVLPKRFSKYGLNIHPTKTRLIRFNRPRGDETACKNNGTFDFLGFTHYWTRSLKKNWVIKRRTMGKRLRRSMKNIWKWCKANRHNKIEEQYSIICAKLRGHYNYYGIRGNIDSMVQLYRHMQRAWKYWLNKRSQRDQITWEKFRKLLNRFPLPTPYIAHNI